MYTDKTAPKLKANATVTYPVHVTLLNFTNEFRRYSIDDGHTLTGLLPLSTAAQIDCAAGEEDEIKDFCKVVSLSDKLSSTNDKDGTDVKHDFICKRMEMILSPLETI